MIISRKTTHLLLILSILVLTVAPSMAASSQQRISREEYIARYKHIAMEHQRYYGIPASITMAQGILESDSGNSRLAKGSNNHFGIKCKKDWKGRTFTHTDDAPNECFRAYPSVEASYEDHATFLDSSPRYDSLFRFSPTDYRSWARGLKGAGYATAPDYTARLVKLIEDNKLYMLDIEADGAVLPERSEILSDISPEPAHEVVRGVSDPSNYHVAVKSHDGYGIYRLNHALYVRAKSGDTIEKIAKTFSLSPNKIVKYNDFDRGHKLSFSEIVYIERKESKWNGNIHFHTVVEGDTMASIAQNYAIRLKTLRRMNKLKGDMEPEVGSPIKLK